MDYKAELGVWLVASLGLSITASWLAWRLRRARSRSVEWLTRRLADTLSGRVVFQLVRLLYYVGLPYAAVLRRALSLVVAGLHGRPDTPGPAWLGWGMSEWVNALGWAAGLGGLLAVVLALAWRNAARATGAPPAARGLWPAPPCWIELREVLLCETHWAFYRAGALLVFSDEYWAVLIGAAFPLLEWALDPDWWMQVNGGPRREQVLMQCLWLAISTLCFSLGRNTWVVLGLHLALALGLNAWLGFLAGRTVEAQAATPA